MDLFSCDSCHLKPGERRLFPVGLQVGIPEGYEMQIRSRSGLALRSGISVLNSPGTVDSGYRGELGVILINHSPNEYFIQEGDKIAQAVISQVERAVLKEVNELSQTSRGEGGFGSTGLSS
jgi:dUTP pyrophosphatase